MGNTTISGRNFMIHMYGTTNTWLQFSLDSFQVKLQRGMDLHEGELVKNLSIFLGRTLITKMTNKKRNQNSDIIEIPGGLMEMHTTQKSDSNVIRYKYLTKFPDAIRVTTFLSEYNDVREIFKQYQTEIRNAQRASSASNAMSSSVTMFEKAKASSKPEPTKPKKSKREFECLEFDLNPKLNVLGDMTPRVETVLNWLGIKDRHVIPSATYNTITNALEIVMVSTQRGSDAVNKVLEEHEVERPK